MNGKVYFFRPSKAEWIKLKDVLADGPVANLDKTSPEYYAKRLARYKQLLEYLFWTRSHAQESARSLAIKVNDPVQLSLQARKIFADEVDSQARVLSFFVSHSDESV